MYARSRCALLDTSLLLLHVTTPHIHSAGGEPVLLRGSVVVTHERKAVAENGTVTYRYPFATLAHHAAAAARAVSDCSP